MFMERNLENKERAKFSEKISIFVKLSAMVFNAWEPISDKKC